MTVYLRLLVLLSLCGCGRPQAPAPEFRSDHYAPGNVSAEHGALRHLPRGSCSPNARLPGNRPIQTPAKPDSPEMVVVVGRFESEGVCDFFTGEKTTLRFFVTYSVSGKAGEFPYSTLSFFADDDCLLDEAGKPVPRNSWPFGHGEMTFHLTRNTPARDGPEYTILSYSKRE